jgi:hypothetical protein
MRLSMLTPVMEARMYSNAGMRWKKLVVGVFWVLE